MELTEIESKPTAINTSSIANPRLTGLIGENDIASKDRILMK
jgi:hypothetical protein